MIPDLTDSVWMARKGLGEGQWSLWYFVGCDEAHRLSEMRNLYEVKRFACVEYLRDTNPE